MTFTFWLGTTNLYVVLCGIVLSISLLGFFRRSTPKGLRLPPGPKGNPIIGNVLDMPKHHEWKAFIEYGKKYGDLIRFNILGQSMIVVNSADVAHDLFDKRSSLYSDRPQFPMLNDLMGLSWNVSLMPYGDRWLRHRKAFQQRFTPTAATAYYDIQTKHTRNMLRKFYDSPDEYVPHIRHLLGAVIMEVIYAIQILPKNDPYVDMAERAMVAISDAGNPWTYLVDALPFLKYVPEWMPGAEFKRKARRARETVTAIRELPFSIVKKELSAGTAKPSYSAHSLEEIFRQPDGQADDEELVCNTAGSAYGAGIDTATSIISVFMLAMVLYPEAQRKAQAELDSVVEAGRLPDFKDREKLPYINAMCKELYRWETPAPLGLAHMVSQDDTYGEYFIPGGSIVVANTWAIFHDERVYGPNADKFVPERFLNTDLPDPTNAFGYGRRVCPGRHLADNSLFIAAVSILKVFDISPALDSRGKEIPVNPKFTSGLVQFPEPFKCSIKPRSAIAESLILENTTEM